MRDLNDADLVIGKEADRAHEEIALRNEVCIEDRDEIGARPLSLSSETKCNTADLISAG